MASSKEYLDYILEQLSGIDDISYRTMMGEYIIYYKGKVIGGIYDNRFLVKETKSSALMLKDAGRELPYQSAKEMFLIEDTYDIDFFIELFEKMYLELKAPKKRGK